MSTERTTHLARLGYRAAAWLFVACLVVQLFLVGLDLFEVPGVAEGIHRDFAYLYGWITPVLLLLAVAGRLRRATLLLTVVLLVLFALQTSLPLVADELPWLAALHSLNAAAIVWLAWRLASTRELLPPRTSQGGS